MTNNDTAHAAMMGYMMPMQNPSATIQISEYHHASGPLVAPMIDGKPQLSRDGKTQIWGKSGNVLSGVWIERVAK